MRYLGVMFSQIGLLTQATQMAQLFMFQQACLNMSDFQKSLGQTRVDDKELRKHFETYGTVQAADPGCLTLFDIVGSAMSDSP